MAGRIPSWSWQQISRAIGLTIVIALLGAFLASFVAKFFGVEVTLNTGLTFAFLGIATGLIGLPSGWQLVIRRGEERSK